MPLAASTAHEVCQVASIDFPTVSDHACEYACVHVGVYHSTCVYVGVYHSTCVCVLNTLNSTRAHVISRPPTLPVRLRQRTAFFPLPRDQEGA